mgnify:CR=1 FL=1
MIWILGGVVVAGTCIGMLFKAKQSIKKVDKVEPKEVIKGAVVGAVGGAIIAFALLFIYKLYNKFNIAEVKSLGEGGPIKPNRTFVPLKPALNTNEFLRAGEIAKELNVSSNRVGREISKLGIRGKPGLSTPYAYDLNNPHKGLRGFYVTGYSYSREAINMIKAALFPHKLVT